MGDIRGLIRLRVRLHNSLEIGLVAHCAIRAGEILRQAVEGSARGEALVGIPLALVLWGAGAALGYPLAISAAADRRTHATARVAAVAAFGTLAGLTMPQAIGLLAERVDLRLALLLLVAVAAGMAALATAARPVADAHPGSEEEGRRADTLEP